MSIKYIAELAKRTDYPPELALPALDFDRANNIYLISTEAHPTASNYWTDWGGTYDSPTNQDAELYFSLFLQKVPTRAIMILTVNSFVIEGNSIYINLPKKPWQYLSSETEYDTVQGYASTVKNELEPSNHNYEDSTGACIPHPVRLLIPSVPNKLSDPISGTTLQTTFNFTLINNDGLFDDTDENNFINTPSRLKRTSVDNPTLADFNIIRYGLVDSVSVIGDSFRVTVADLSRTLTESVTRKFTVTDYPNIPDSSRDKDMPVSWGVQEQVPLFEIDTGEYIALDPDYITAVTTVYDKDDASISFTFDSGTGIISATDAVTADVTGKTDKAIGEIITTEMASKGNIPYAEGPWDKTETDLYIALSADINFYFKGGTLKKLITDVLKNDNAFLFTKNNGKLTLRQWGQTYTEHLIDSWRIMALPTKNNAEGKKYFMSAVTIQYDKNEKTGLYDLEYFDDSQERAISEEWNKKKSVTFPTNLDDTNDVIDLAERLLDRFGRVPELLKVKLGYDTSEVELLDEIALPMIINGRTMSNYTGWVVREVDPAQDTLLLESSKKEVFNNMVLGITGGNMVLGLTGSDMILGVPYRYEI